MRSLYKELAKLGIPAQQATHIVGIGLNAEIQQTRDRLMILETTKKRLLARNGGGESAVAKRGMAPKRGRMTAEGRKRISNMMKKRWRNAKKDGATDLKKH